MLQNHERSIGWAERLVPKVTFADLQTLTAIAMQRFAMRKPMPLRSCLVHGGPWGGNVATNLDSNDLVIIDSTCIYAHNEY